MSAFVQVYQHLYLGFLYGLLAITKIVYDDFVVLTSGWIGPIPVNQMHLEEKIVFFGGKFFYFLWYFCIPAICSCHSFGELMLLWSVAQLICGWTLAFLFQVNHVTEKVDFYEKEGDKVSVGWVRCQIEGTSDFAHGSWLWTNISGGLNYQAVHHLFPSVCHMHYPEIAPIVKEICKEERINYVVYPTFFSALTGHYRLMKSVGKRE